ncbi:MAG: fumarylacetoacetate hydrolase family protein [Phycisphaerae bacterium]|nr:fumarylacetoacetate hydrolase family protein [Phycisphaerae bacterium]
MKYIRFIDQNNIEQIGILNNNIIELLDGDLLDNPTLTGQTCSIDSIKAYLPPVTPPNLLAIGKNYAAHAAEFGTPLPKEPLIFIKSATSITAHNQPIQKPQQAPDFIDYEAELAIVIGKKAKNINPNQVPDHIFGYTCANDVTARDCQKNDGQWARAKSFDTFCPIGPVVETELDTKKLTVRSILNGNIMQDGNTADMVFPVNELVSYISKHMTLLPGTVILTGTPDGIGFARDPQVLMQNGDKITIEIEGIGKLVNYVENE